MADDHAVVRVGLAAVLALGNDKSSAEGADGTSPSNCFTIRPLQLRIAWMISP